jgi:hypothetical protein
MKLVIATFILLQRRPKKRAGREMTECSNSTRRNASTRYVFVTAMTIFASLSLRDVFVTVWDMMLGQISRTGAGRLIGFKVLLFMVVLVVAVMLAVYWPFDSNCDVI